jgi:hypothetical protein
MKSLALAVVMAVVLGAAGGAAAQQAPSSTPDSSQAPTDSKKNTNVEVNIGGSARPGADASSPAAPAAPAPGAPAQTETKSPDLKSENRQDTSKDDSVAASPRSTGDRSMIFGLNPVTAVVIAAALLVVVILAIVAMTKGNNDTYIDTHRGV